MSDDTQLRWGGKLRVVKRTLNNGSACYVVQESYLGYLADPQWTDVQGFGSTDVEARAFQLADIIYGQQIVSEEVVAQ